jgi:hypothetical protein
MLPCEPLAAAVCCRCWCWGVVHGGERRSKHGGVQEAGKCGGVAWADPTCVCSRRVGIRTQVACPDVQVLVMPLM